MAFLTTNYSNVNESNNEYTAIPTGDYECTIEQVRHDAAPSGTEFIEFRLRVRNDLDKALPKTNGKAHNRVVFDRQWKNRKTGKFNQNNLQYVLKAAGIPENKNIATFEDFMKVLKGKNVLVHIKNEKDTYKSDKQGTEVRRNAVDPWGYSETKFKTEADDPFKDSSQQVDIDNNDLPF